MRTRPSKHAGDASPPADDHHDGLPTQAPGTSTSPSPSPNTNPQPASSSSDYGRTSSPRRSMLFPRLGMEAPSRVLGAGTAAFLLGFGLGATEGGRAAQLRFRAEHAHRMPATTADWYFYHKSKNYQAAFGSLREGLRMGPRLALLASGLVWVEHTVDVFRGGADFMSTVVASVAVSGAVSLWNRFPLTTTARTTRSAFIFGLVYGGAQDVLNMIRGEPVGFVEFLRRRWHRSNAGRQVAEQP